jgi:hypothetical protein
MPITEIKELAKRNAAIFIQTITLCSAVGVELGQKYIKYEVTPYLLILISLFYNQRIENLINRLVEYGQIKKNAAPDLIGKIDTGLFKIYVRVTNLGSFYCNEVKIKNLENGKSPFLNCLLKNLSDSGLVQEMQKRKMH